MTNVNYATINFDPKVVPTLPIAQRLLDNTIKNLTEDASLMGILQNFYAVTASLDALNTVFDKIAPNREANALNKAISYVSMIASASLVKEASEHTDVTDKFAVVGTFSEIADIDPSLNRLVIVMLCYDEGSNPSLVWGFLDDALDIFPELQKNII